MTTIKDVAKKVGMSISTVSYALNDRPNVHPDTKAKILLAAKEMNYHPNGNARNLKKQKTGNIGVFVYGFAGPIFSDVLDGIHQKLQEHNLNIIVSSGNSSTNLLLQRQVDAAIVFDDHLKDEDLINYAKSGSPVCVLDRYLDGENVYASVIDNERLVYRFIQDQIAKGYRDFAYLSGPEEAFNNIHRFLGFQQAMEEHNLSFEVFTGDFTVHSGHKWGEVLAQRKERPRFVFCANDESAVGLIQALTANGVRVPEDIAIAGFDNIALGNFTHPALTTIGIDHFKWGKDVAESVIKTLNQEPTPQTIHPSGHVIVRQSC